MALPRRLKNTEDVINAVWNCAVGNASSSSEDEENYVCVSPTLTIESVRKNATEIHVQKQMEENEGQCESDDPDYMPNSSMETSMEDSFLDKTNTNNELKVTEETTSTPEKLHDKNPLQEIPIPNTEATSSIMIETESTTEESVQPRERKRKYEPNRENKWKRHENEEARVKGLMYTNKPSRSMGKSCDSKFCKKSSHRQCDEISIENRCKMFDHFWGDLKSWEERKLLVKSLVQRKELKQKKAGTASRRSCTWQYSLMYKGQKWAVCKKLFCSTLAIPERTVMSWLHLQNEEDQLVVPTPQGEDQRITTKDLPDRSNKKRKLVHNSKPEEKVYLSTFLSSLATVPSHYARSKYRHLKFLEPRTTLTGLHQEYQREARKAGLNGLSIKTFNNTFHAENFSIFVPRKDQCDTCVGYKHGSVSQEVYERHYGLEKEAQRQKSLDKEKAQANPNISSWTMDLQAVMLCPKTDASSMFYKTKLKLHNFTLYSLDTKEAFCYVWDETEGSLSGEVFAWMIYHHFKQYLQSHPNISELFLWSDGCGYQNRNSTLSNALLHLAKECSVTVYQKFLISGHTQMECDSMHACIERKCRGPMYAPCDYIRAIEIAREKKGPQQPYFVKRLTHKDFFKGFENLYLSSIRPGKKTGDPVVFDIRGLKYTDQVYYILDFKDQWQLLPQRMEGNPRVAFTRLFKGRLAIKIRKYQDLQSLKSVIPAELHSLYDALPNK